MARKREPIKIIVHKPSDEVVSKLMARAFAQIIDDRIQALPEEMRVPTYDAIIESLEKPV